MGKSGGFLSIVTAVLLGLAALPAQAEVMRVDGYFPAASDEAANLRSIAVANFTGEDGPQLSLLVADNLRAVELGGQPWLAVLVGNRARDAEAVLGGNVRTRFVENPITQRRNVCIAYDSYNTCTERADQDFACLQVIAHVRPDLRLVRDDGRLMWSFSQENSRSAEYCPDLDATPDFEASIDQMHNEFSRTVRYALAPSYSSRDIRVLEGRGDLARLLRDPFRSAIRLVERDTNAACDAFAALLLQAPAHNKLGFNNALCAERRGDYAGAAEVYYRLANGRGAAREGREGLARIEQYRRARLQLERRGW